MDPNNSQENYLKQSFSKNFVKKSVIIIQGKLINSKRKPDKMIFIYLFDPGQSWKKMLNYIFLAMTSI